MEQSPTTPDLSGTRDLPGPATLADSLKSQHERLWLAAITRPLDFEPYGLRVRDGNDCSCGCRHFIPLDGALGLDWGVCDNPQSHRCGLLTFEHMGCPHFKFGEDADEEVE